MSTEANFSIFASYLRNLAPVCIIVCVDFNTCDEIFSCFLFLTVTVSVYCVV